MTFDFGDIITITSVFELCFFILFILFKAHKPYYNKILLLVFASQAIGITSWILRKYNIFDDIAYIFKVFDLLWAPTLFLYAEALTKKREQPGIYHYFHALPFLLVLVYSFIGFAVTIPDPPVSAIVNIQVIIYIIAGVVIIARYHRIVKENFSKDESKIRQWVTVVLLGYALACLTPVVAFHFGLFNGQSDITKEVVGFLPFLLFYNILFFNAVENPVVIHDLPFEEKYQGSRLTDDLAKKYLEKLNNTVESEKCYLEPELTLGSLSESSGIPARYLSQIINQYKRKSFYDYINGLRAEYACKLLLSDNRKTVLEILYESGFNSKTSFNTFFKKHTGISPTQFKTKNKISGSGL